MISIFTSFRSFEIPEYNFLQTKAYKSWLNLNPIPEIIVLGDAPGVSEVCKNNNFIHCSKVKSAESGAPFIDSYIKRAERVASHQYMLMLSSDIFIENDTYQVLDSVKNRFDKFCVCARKFNFFYDDSDSLVKVRWGNWQAGDYFLYTKGLFKTIPPFIIGRCALDNWIYRHLVEQNCMINASGVATVYHHIHKHGVDIGKELRAKEVQDNRDLYKKNYINMSFWQDKEWYLPKINPDIRFANYKMLSDFTIIENPDPYSTENDLC